MEVIKSGRAKLNIVEPHMENGVERWVRTDKVPYTYPETNERAVLVAALDITSLKEAELALEERTIKLEQTNADLEQFAYVASHDLKAPLRGLDNLAQWIAEDLGEDVDGDIKEKLDLMQGRVARMEALLSDILAYSRAGSRESPPEKLDLNAIIKVNDGKNFPCL